MPSHKIVITFPGPTWISVVKENHIGSAFRDPSLDKKKLSSLYNDSCVESDSYALVNAHNVWIY